MNLKLGAIVIFGPEGQTPGLDPASGRLQPPERKSRKETDSND